MLLSVCLAALSGASPLHAAPGFRVAATDVTMPASGNGVSKITLKSVDGFAGAVGVVCGLSGSAPAGAKLPSCAYGPVASLPIAANQTVQSELQFYPYGTAVPLGTATLARPAAARILPAALALGGVFLWGVGRRRKAWRWFTLLIAAGLASAGISACGGGSSMTPGTYAYTITAANTAGDQSAQTTIHVTVP